MTATMRDIARAAGVSVGAVSQVLNGRDGVSAALAERVLAAAEALQYRHKNRPRQARGRLLRRIGFVTSGDAAVVARPFYAAILAGAAAECDELGMAVTYCPVSDSAGAGRLADAGVDGLLLAGYMVPELVRRVAEVRLPFVVASHDPDGIACDRVLFDDFAGGRLAGEALVRRGHLWRAAIHGPLERPLVRRRVEGFRAAVQEARPGIVLTTHELPAAGQNPDGGYGATKTLFQDRHQPTPTAVFCTSDRIAFGALRALRELGRPVPEQVSVVGFNDYEAAAHAHPPLTTVRTDTALMGRLAVRRLLERAREPQAPPVTLTIGVELVERESVGVARQCT